jgi:hypothetical protein
VLVLQLSHVLLLNAVPACQHRMLQHCTLSSCSTYRTQHLETFKPDGVDALVEWVT